jgi:hypothetical protein
LAEKSKPDNAPFHQIAVQEFSAFLATQGGEPMIFFFPMLWPLIMWDFVCVNAGLRPLVECSSPPSE